jgi:cytochrome c
MSNQRRNRRQAMTPAASTSRRTALGLLCGLVLGAASASPRYRSSQEARAQALLDRAVAHLRQRGEAGAADFARQSAFVDRDLYVYALRSDGRFLASGGASAALVGENVLGVTDAAGRKYFSDMIAQARARGGGRIEYLWFDPVDGRDRPRQTLFSKVGEVIVAVGFLAPRATPVEAKAMLRKAVKSMRRDEKAALREFQAYPGPFIRDDLYVFVIDLASGRFLANGANPALVGTDARALRDARGQPIVTEAMEALARGRRGEAGYSWRNPVTGRVESKHTFFRNVDGKLVGVGYFTR